MKYQDYVIKNGNFVGKFEKMYQKFENPWHQSDPATRSSISRQAVSYYVNKYNIQSIVEFGCGLGDTAASIKRLVDHEVDYLGIDISQTAIAAARTKHTDIKFDIDDCSNIQDYSNFQAIFFSEITWYLLEEEKLDRIFDKMKTLFSGGEKFFIHNSVFYKNGLQRYGNNYFTSLEEFVSFCPFELLGTTEVNDLENNVAVETCSIFKV
jgi:SAM-dependent methyltransferase